MDLKKNKERVFASVAEAETKAQRPPHSVNIIAVTKTVDVATAKELVDLGVQHLAENRVDKFLEKYHALQEEEITWHLIGSLQRRKVKDVIHLVDYFHALDSVKLAQEIDKRAEHPIRCFLQVNLSKEESKHGFYREELDQVLPEIAALTNIQIVGLMTMAPFDADESELSQLFSDLEALRQELEGHHYPNMSFSELSMGMSRDYQIAIEHGATFVRIGTSFFK